MTRKNQNLSRDEAARLREVAEYHGITASTGPYVGKGSAFALQLAIINGDAAIISIDPDDRQALAAWLNEQAAAAPAHLTELVQALVAELVYGL
jgi:hypothetical protein